MSEELPGAVAFSAAIEAADNSKSRHKDLGADQNKAPERNNKTHLQFALGQRRGRRVAVASLYQVKGTSLGTQQHVPPNLHERPALIGSPVWEARCPLPYPADIDDAPRFGQQNTCATDWGLGRSTLVPMPAPD
ncbi:hypothetical protein MTO96_009578 [Rhipicephalus appendiculatus]